MDLHSWKYLTFPIILWAKNSQDCHYLLEMKKLKSRKVMSLDAKPMLLHWGKYEGGLDQIDQYQL